MAKTGMANLKKKKKIFTTYPKPIASEEAKVPISRFQTIYNLLSVTIKSPI
jgi:hypothetical protein